MTQADCAIHKAQSWWPLTATRLMPNGVPRSFLREQPTEPIAEALRKALATQLMVSLARAIYRDPPDHDPAELIKHNTLQRAAELTKHTFWMRSYRPFTAC